MLEESKIHAKLIRIAKKNHPELAKAIKNNGVILLKRRDEKDLFNFLAHTVAGQQLSKAAAATIWNRLTLYASDKNTSLKNLCIKKNSERLRDCGLSKNKVTALIELNKAFENDEISEEQILQANYEEISNTVVKLRGFGQWSADMVAMFYVCLTDIWAPGDGALIRGIKKYADDSAPSDEVVNHYSPYRTYLALHIWKALDNEKK